MRASTRGRTRPSRSPPRPRARRSPAVRPSAERRRVQGRCFPSWAWLRSCHHTSRTRSVATESERRRPTLLSRGRVAIRGVLAWKGTHAGLFLLLVGGGVGLPLPEDLTLLAAGVLAHQHVLRLRDVIAIGFAGVVCADCVLYLAGRRSAFCSPVGPSSSRATSVGCSTGSCCSACWPSRSTWGCARGSAAPASAARGRSPAIPRAAGGTLASENATSEPRTRLCNRSVTLPASSGGSPA